jgi:hypothetical protein
MLRFQRFFYEKPFRIAALAPSLAKEGANPLMRGTSAYTKISVYKSAGRKRGARSQKPEEEHLHETIRRVEQEVKEKHKKAQEYNFLCACLPTRQAFLGLCLCGEKFTPLSLEQTDGKALYGL